jgi:hypothetical protein
MAKPLRKTEEPRILILEQGSVSSLEEAQTKCRAAAISTSACCVKTSDECIEAIGRAMPNLILADPQLLTFDKDSLVATAKANCPDVPLVFVTGLNGSGFMVRSLPYARKRLIDQVSCRF